MRTLGWRDCLELSGWAQYNFKITYKKEAVLGIKKEDVGVEPEGRVMLCEAGGRDHETGNAGSFRKRKKAK